MAGITYKKILHQEDITSSLLGMSIVEFEAFYTAFELAHIAREHSLQFTRRSKQKRKRIVGAGRKHKYALRDRLFMTLF